MIANKLNFFKVKNVHSDISIQEVVEVFKEENIKYAVVYEVEDIIGIVTRNELLDVYFGERSLKESIKNIINGHFCFKKNSSKLDEIISILEEYPNMYIILGWDPKKATGVITKEIVLDYFYGEIKRKIAEYKVENSNNEIVLKDHKWNITRLINHLDYINLWNRELDQAFENAPVAITIIDGVGNLLRVNKEYENITGVKENEITEKNVRDMEDRGIYNPSVAMLVLREKRKISVVQKMGNGARAVATGVPIYDGDGNIFRIITSAIDLKELDIINQYYAKQKTEKMMQAKDEDRKIIYKSESMKKIIQLANELKDVDSTVLITGESGVGKGVVARYIHYNGIRKNGRMIEINCGAIPETLLESELLGYESGAFTGAKKGGKHGLVELANGGTLFLDEIGEMSMSLQIKLLQVIQEKQIIRVGGIKPIDVDVRIIAATNRDLQQMIKDGKFRLDLYYRLNVIPINILALRERKLDIIPMVKYFVDKYNRKYSKEVIIGKSILDMILAYDWPGNVRELENTIERLVVTNPSGVIEKEDNQYEIFSLNTYNNHSLYSNLVDNRMPLEEAKKEIEKKLIKIAYEKYKSSYKVAKFLKISQATAHRKIREYIGEK